MRANSFFVDVSNAPPPQIDLWPPVVISKEAIDAEIEHLAEQAQPSNGRRESLIVHPESTPPALGLAPGIRVTLAVLKPGESTQPIRHNATEVNFCIQGGGYSLVDGERFDFVQYDAWNLPSFVIYQHCNDTDDLQVRLTYSNAPLLERMNIHYVETAPSLAVEGAMDKTAKSGGVERPNAGNHPFGTFRLNDSGAHLMPYEQLISPPSVDSKTLHWPWREVKARLDELASLGKEYVGRRLYLLYNPMTGRTNGTTPSFFATITVRPGNIIDRPHRHTSAAINYYFAGSGYSVVEGQRYEWKAGDLMLSAPGWAVHNHASLADTVYELTIQDQPLNIAMESLIWQESLKQQPRILGKEAGFDTNRRKAG